MSDGEVDPRALTQAAGAAARTLTEVGSASQSLRAAPPSHNLIGKDLAHFRIEKRIGKGGMGEVYLATDLALERPVALKVLAPEIAADEASRKRFIREARSQARLVHPNICHIYFIGEDEGRLFFAMEYVDGENLQDRLEREGRVPVDEAVELCRQAAAGLAEAYRHGFTHRDVKPSNLLVNRHGVVKVADFGLVKDSARGDVSETGDDVHIVGTPLYMSPEQARGDAVDFRADVYALGVTLHQLVAGKPPFSGPTPLAVVSMHLSEPRPRLEAARGRAALVDALCDWMMAKRPVDRPAAYDQVIAALEDLSPSVTRPAGFWARSLALGLDLLIAIAVGGILAAIADLSGNLPILAVLGVMLVVCHARWGVTPGKAALELQVISTRALGRRRGIGWKRAAVRLLVELGPTYLGIGLELILQLSDELHPKWLSVIAHVAVSTLMIVPPLVLGLTAIRNAGKRALWDRAAGTRVVYRRHRG